MYPIEEADDMSAPVLVLSARERKRFVAYLRCDAAADVEMVEYAEKLPGLSHMVERLKGRAAAKRIVADELDSIEEMTV